MACVCGHAVEDHGGDPDYPGSTACGGLLDDDSDCECIAFELDYEDDDEIADSNDEW